MATDISIHKQVAETLKKYVHLEPLKWVTDNVKVEKITDHDIHDTFRVSDVNDVSNSVTVKYFAPLDIANPDNQAVSVRPEMEFRARNTVEELAPGCIAKPIFFDNEAKMICMEDLKGYNVYRTSLISGHVDDTAALKLVKDIALIHVGTHRNTIGEDALSKLDAQFKNTPSLHNQELLIFTAPFSKDSATNRCSDSIRKRLDWVYGDEEVLQAAANMRKIFLQRKEALLHGDLHTGSVMVMDEDSKLSNCEHCRVGPCSFDIGMLVANYIFTYYCHLMQPRDNEDHRLFAYRIVDICNKTVDEYLVHMTICSEDIDTYQAKFISEVAGFAGCEIIRRVVGADHVAEFDHTEGMELDTLGAGVRLLKAYHRIHSIGTLMLIALMLA